MKKIFTVFSVMLLAGLFSAQVAISQINPITVADTEERYTFGPTMANTEVLWEQENNGNSGIVSDRFMGMAGQPIVLAADDFTLAERSEIQFVTIPGFINAQDYNVRGQGFELFIFASVNNAPSGTPSVPDAAIWYKNFGLTTAGITINDEGAVVEFIVDIETAGGEKLILEPGQYWVAGAAKVNSPGIDGNTRWNWYQGTPQAADAHLIDPNDLFAGGLTAWTSFTNIGLTFTNLAFRIEGISGVEFAEPGPFGLLSPANNTQITLDPEVSTLVSFTWEASENTTSYTWRAIEAGGDLNSNDALSLVSDFSGASTTLRLPNFAFYNEMIARGHNHGDTIEMEWSIRASVGGNALYADEIFNVTFIMGEATNIENENTPFSFELAQNYPNPFNPTTNINFTLPYSSDVTLEVFNMQGQKVATLVNSTMNVGSHTVPFNAENLSSGIYMYRLTAGSFTQTNKMMLVK